MNIYALIIATFFHCGPVFAQESSCKGIFSLWNVDQVPQELSDIEKPFVQGASIRFSWERLEPAQGQFQWQVIDTALEKVASFNKPVVLRITAGTRSPQWVYERCACLIVSEAELSGKLNPRRAKLFNAVKGRKMPIPWDESYLSLWKSFVSSLGKRYNGDTRIVLIQMSGGGFAGEMFLGKELDWKKHGYEPQKIVDMWKRIIDFYVESFPDKAVALDIGAPLRTDYEIMNTVIEYCLTQYPRNVFIQYNGLEGRTDVNTEYDNAIALASKSTTVGYQMTGGKDWFPERMGSYHTAFGKGLKNKASYFEIYRSDILADDLQDELRWLNKQVHK